jgi:hypothetical protein
VRLLCNLPAFVAKLREGASYAFLPEEGEKFVSFRLECGVPQVITSWVFMIVQERPCLTLSSHTNQHGSIPRRLTVYVHPLLVHSFKAIVLLSADLCACDTHARRQLRLTKRASLEQMSYNESNTSDRLPTSQCHNHNTVSECRAVPHPRTTRSPGSASHRLTDGQRAVPLG